VTESQNKIVFRDFSVPVHHGKGRASPAKLSHSGSQVMKAD